MPARRRTRTRSKKKVLKRRRTKTRTRSKRSVRGGSKRRRVTRRRTRSIRGHGDYHMGSYLPYKRVPATSEIGAKMSSAYRRYAGVYAGAHIGKQIGGALGGTFLGGAMGVHPGALAGSMIGGSIGGIIGAGDYKVQANTLAIPGTQIPSFDENGRHCVRIRHREYCFDLKSNANPYAVTGYSLNPTNSALFPFLSTIASQFEEYRWSGLVFEFRTESAYSASTSLGNIGYVALATNYNATEPTYGTKTQFENSEFAVSGPITSNVFHPIECKRSETVVSELYINPTGGPVPTGEDLRLYDIGQLQIATGNAQSSGFVMGTFWASYDICLYKPISGLCMNNNPSAHYHSATGVTFASTSPAYFGSSQFQSTGSNMQLSFGATTFGLPSNAPIGNYLVQLGYYNSGSTFSSTSASTFYPTITPTQSLSALSLFGSDSVSQFKSINQVGTTTGNFNQILNTSTWTVTGPQPVWTLSGGTNIGAGMNYDLLVTGLNNLLIN